jgi:hypothetical protein
MLHVQELKMQDSDVMSYLPVEYKKVRGLCLVVVRCMCAFVRFVLVYCEGRG